MFYKIATKSLRSYNKAIVAQRQNPMRDLQSETAQHRLNHRYRRTAHRYRRCTKNRWSALVCS